MGVLLATHYPNCRNNDRIETFSLATLKVGTIIAQNPSIQIQNEREINTPDILQ